MRRRHQVAFQAAFQATFQVAFQAAFIAGVCLLNACASLAQPTAPPTQPARARTVNGQRLTSTAQPAVQLEFAPAFQYSGTQSFLLYGVAQAEQHFFVAADSARRIQRLYWVQFEHYLPDNQRQYNYPASPTLTLGGLEFLTDAATWSAQTAERPDSDGSRMRAYLNAQGYRWPANEMRLQRLVHLPDAARRHELMLIYLEAVSPSEPPATLLERAQQGLRVLR